MLNDNKDLKLKDPAMDVLGDTLKIAKQENVSKINEMRQKEQAKKDGK